MNCGGKLHSNWLLSQPVTTAASAFIFDGSWRNFGRQVSNQVNLSGLSSDYYPISIALPMLGGLMTKRTLGTDLYHGYFVVLFLYRDLVNRGFYHATLLSKFWHDDAAQRAGDTLIATEPDRPPSLPSREASYLHEEPIKVSFLDWPIRYASASKQRDCHGSGLKARRGNSSLPTR
jgi:hypothetical protein